MTPQFTCPDLPTRSDYERIEYEYISSLAPKKQQKALISQEMFDDIWDVLHDPRDSSLSTSQFRFWVRKMFTLATLETLRANLPASIPIIGCGGISTGRDALDYAQAGASYVQLYTSFGYDGVGTARRIKDELSEELKKLGTTWKDVVRESVQRTSLQERSDNDSTRQPEATVQL